MSDPSTARHPFEVLAEEFAERCRRGEQPPVTEYTARHPELADRIRTLFPTVQFMEDMKRHRSMGLPVPIASRMPERLGEFRILREVGRGGMGIVYEAEQESLGRHVAVKVLTAQALLDVDQLRRFHREAQTMARLHHTNIVPLFGVGEHEGMPYLVMQFIDGRGLDEVIASGEWLVAGADRVPPATRWRQAATIAVQVADALRYAHGQGTVHRDIKPSNLLLDARGTVWVTDFGLAKLIEHDDLTRPGETAGTLRYMAPERFQGQSDARGDVYSLGLTLYELLTLRPAFEESDRRQLIRRVMEEEPLSPRKLDPEIPRDLETIVLRAIARDPAHRYRSALELAEDLHRFLDDKPVMARRVGPIERVWRWCRRNPAVACLTAIAASLLLLVALVASVAYVQTRAALSREAMLHQQAEVQRERAETNLELARIANVRGSEQHQEAIGQRRRAEANLALALRAFEEIFAQATRRDLVRDTTDPDTDDSQAEPACPPVASPELAVLLQNLLKFYDKFGERNRADPRLQREIARAYRRVGDIQQRLGQFESAEAAYRRALSFYEDTTSGKPPSGDNTRETAAIHNELGRVLQMTGRNAEAEREHRLALRILRDHEQTQAIRYELARTQNILGSLRGKIGRWEQGEQNHRRALELIEGLRQEDATNPDYRLAQARSYMNLASALAFRGPRQEAATSQRTAISLLEELAADFPTFPDYRYELSDVLMRSSVSRRPQSSAEVDPKLRRATELATDLAITYPAVPEYQALRARSLQRLGQSLQNSGKTSEAEPLQAQAVELHRSLVRQFPTVPIYHLYFAEACQSRAVVLLRRGELADSCALLRDAIDAQQQYLKGTPNNRFGRHTLAHQYQDLAEVLRRQGEQAQAEEAARKAERARKGP